MKNLTSIPQNDLQKSQDNPFSYIPMDVLELLWFCDGPLKNCDKDNSRKPYLTFEPSKKINSQYRKIVCAISIKKPLCVTEEIPENQSFNYSDYSEFSSVQRGVFISWLQNIEKPCSPYIFSAFLAHLDCFSIWVPQKRELVCNMLNRIMNSHSYSDHICSQCRCQLLRTYFYMKDYTKLFELTSECIDKNINDIYASSEFLSFKDYLNIPLTPKEILWVIKSQLYGRKVNKRYIEKYPELYEHFLGETIKELHNSDSYSLFIHRKDAIKRPFRFMDENEETNLTCYVIDSSKTFVDNLIIMANLTHERIKQIPPSRRTMSCFNEKK